MGKEFSDAYFSMVEAQWGAGDFGRTLVDSVRRASLQVGIGQTNVAGVYLPVFHESAREGDDAIFKQLGITGGGASIQRCAEKFNVVLKNLIMIAGLQTSFITLDEVIRVTSRRVNALENVVIPKILGNIEYIKRELDEQEREDFFRLKKVQSYKKVHNEREAAQKESEDRVRLPSVLEDESVLEAKDEDIIF